MKKSIRIISVYLILSIILSACGSVKALQDEEDGKSYMEEGKLAIEAELNIPLTRLSSLDPLNNTNFSYYNFSKLIYQSLFELDTSFKPVPLLVENYRIGDEGRTIEIQLKDDIYWHNGDKFTARDVEFTIEQLKNLEDVSIYSKILTSGLGSFNRANIKNIIRTKVVDETRIEIYFDKLYGNNLELLTFPIVNEKSYLSDGRYLPIGTGPFTYLDYNASQAISLIKNDNYWDGDVGITKINGKIFENEESILMAFENGRVDFAYSIGVDLKEYEKNPNINILEYISPEYEFLGYNFGKDLLSGEDGRAIRKAIYYGIDRQEIIEEVYLGHASQVDTPIYPQSYLTQGVTNTYGYNKGKAKDILKGIGFEEIGRDGVLQDSLGRKLSFQLVTNYSNPDRRQTAEIIKRNLQDIGIEIVFKYPYSGIDSLDKKSLDQEWDELNKIIRRGDYDLSILGWELSELNDTSFMFHSSFINTGSNVVGYKDDEMDDLLEAIYFSSRQDKLARYIDLQEKIMEELPYASLFFKNKALLLRGNIKGDFNPTFFNIYRGIEKYKLLE